MPIPPPADYGNYKQDYGNYQQPYGSGYGNYQQQSPYGNYQQPVRSIPQQPSCMDKMKLGFKMGMCVGLASGLIFGGISALRFGVRGRELVQTVGKTMIQGGFTFGTFMSIGMGIRC